MWPRRATLWEASHRLQQVECLSVVGDEDHLVGAVLSADGLEQLKQHLVVCDGGGRGMGAGREGRGRQHIPPCMRPTCSLPLCMAWQAPGEYRGSTSGSLETAWVEVWDECQYAQGGFPWGMDK